MPSLDPPAIDGHPVPHESAPAAPAWRRAGRRASQVVAALLVTVLVLPYALVPVYTAHSATPFSGPSLFNPYAKAGATWQRANFHAHSRAWGGLTSGRQSVDAVHAAYIARGYDVAGLSNYHLISRAAGDTSFLPIYEHGFSIRKTHQLVIGAREVTAFDIPLWQTTQAKQYLLAQLRDTAALTAVVHPYLRTGYGIPQLASLSGYDLLEVRSHWNDASRWWDAVLTAGNAVWAIGNDDSHDVQNSREVGVVWTMVNASSARAPQVLDALRAGAMYVVAGSDSASAAHLRSVTLSGDTITTTFDRTMTNIQVITDGGIVRAQVDGAIAMQYVLTPADHYARVVATDAGGTLYLNPVIRSAGRPAPWGVPGTQPIASLLSRLGALLLWGGALALLLRGTVARRLRKQRGLVVASPRTSRLIALFAMVLAWPGAAIAQTQTRIQGQTQTQTQDQAQTQTLAPPAALPFRIGDYHEYDLKFGAITVGSGSLSVSGPDTLRGREVLRLRYEINGGIPFFRVHDVMESWFDTESMHSLRFTQDLNEGPKHYNRHFDFYPSEKIMLERGKPRAATVGSPLDEASFIFFVRTLRMSPGETHSVSRYFRIDANPVTIQVLRRETITVPAGTFNTVVVRPIIRTSGIFSEGGQAELWFTDDALHTLIQLKAKLSFGSLGLYLRPARNRR